MRTKKQFRSLIQKVFVFLSCMSFFFHSSNSLGIPFQGSNILISGPSPYATEVGIKIAKAGGNVVDVAVGIALSLAVTSPYFGSLGGGGFALIKVNSKVEALDFREVAPKATSPDFYEKLPKEASMKGGSAVGVPGIPAGLWEMHKKLGKLKWKSLFVEPLKLAQTGFRVSGEWVENTSTMKDVFDSGGVKHFLQSDKSVIKPGALFIQNDLARALTLFRDQNVQGFYQGAVAQDIINSSKKTGGVLTKGDLEEYKVRWLTPMVTTFKDFTLYLMPPPSSGGVVIQTAMELVNRINLDKKELWSADEFHLLGEVLARSFKGRSLLGDPSYTKNPVEELLNNSYLDLMAKSIKGDRAVEWEGQPKIKSENKESTETTHFSVLDSKGNSVSMTITLNGNYGSGVVTEQYGIALNNEMDDFATNLKEPNMYGLIQGSANSVVPGKRPLSSMSPTIVEKKNETVLTLGAPGGPRIISGVFQVLYRTLVNGLNIDQAIQGPRVHHQYRPQRLFLDRERFTPETVKALKEKGHQIEFVKAIAKVYGITRNPETGLLEAAYDSRGEGSAGGY